jgi:single-strand DNA-binding protein
MAELNRVFLIGRLTRDPQSKQVGGTTLATLGLATSKTYYDKQDQKKEATLFVDIDVWGKQADACLQYLSKGSAVHIEGELEFRTWDDGKTGEKRSKVSVKADRVQFLDSKPRGERTEQAPNPTSTRREQKPVETAKSAAVAAADDIDDELDPPF